MSLLGPGEDAEKALAMALVYQAVAEEGLGEVAQASWHWASAVAIYANVQGISASVVGQPMNALRGRVHQECRGDPPPPAFEGGVVDPPRIKNKVLPRYTLGAREFQIEGELLISLVIGADGQPRCPKVVQSLPTPSLTVAALEAVYSWRFEPATVEGEPVPSTLQVSTNFDLE